MKTTAETGGTRRVVTPTHSQMDRETTSDSKRGEKQTASWDSVRKERHRSVWVNTRVLNGWKGDRALVPGPRAQARCPVRLLAGPRPRGGSEGPCSRRGAGVSVPRTTGLEVSPPPLCLQCPLAWPKHSPDADLDSGDRGQGPRRSGRGRGAFPVIAFSPLGSQTPNQTGSERRDNSGHGRGRDEGAPAALRDSGPPPDLRRSRPAMLGHCVPPGSSLQGHPCLVPKREGERGP